MFKENYGPKETGLSFCRFQVITEEYILAMKKFSGHEILERSVSKHTLTMVKDLMKVEYDAKDQRRAVVNANKPGCMILVRVVNIPFGKTMGEKLRQSRKLLGLDQKFAIVVDVEETSSGGIAKLLKNDSSEKMRNTECDWVERLRKANGKSPESYEDLKDLPCILILCEKGKMGDTFPKSLRYYDLRMRYAESCRVRAPVEQDLGRAFRYGETTGYPFPIILVGAACAKQLKGEQRQTQQLIKLLPDTADKISPDTKP